MQSIALYPMPRPGCADGFPSCVIFAIRETVHAAQEIRSFSWPKGSLKADMNEWIEVVKRLLLGNGSKCAFLRETGVHWADTGEDLGRQRTAFGSAGFLQVSRTDEIVSQTR